MTVCLSMIVRDEAHCVTTALDSVAGLIDYWVIVDTGSTDGTQQVITEHMARLGVPGELVERPWRNFGHNRTEAVELAQGKCDLVFVLDADDRVEGSLDLSGFGADVGMVRMSSRESEYWYPCVFRDGVDIVYRGVTHEYVEHAGVQARVEGDYRVIDGHVSSRNRDGRKFTEDRDLLLAEVERDPADTRSVFYLAQSYYCLGDWGNAIRWYGKRAEMGGFGEEVYYSRLRIAEAMQSRGDSWPLVLEAFLAAYECRPSRLEAMHAIVRHYRSTEQWALGYLFAKSVHGQPFPADLLFVDGPIHRWRIADELSICAYWTGRYGESLALCDELLARVDLPDRDRVRVESNRGFAVGKTGV